MFRFHLVDEFNFELIMKFEIDFVSYYIPIKINELYFIVCCNIKYNIVIIYYVSEMYFSLAVNAF